MADHYKLQHVAESGHVVLFRSQYARMYTHFLAQANVVLKRDYQSYRNEPYHLQHLQKTVKPQHQNSDKS